MELSQIKRQMQDHLQEGLLLIVGTGLSIAEGVPGMGALAEYLKREIPSKLLCSPDPGWDQVVAALDGGDNLEVAMGKTRLLATTVEAIVGITADLVLSAELRVFQRVIEGTTVLPFTIFARHLFKAGRRFHLITPNYDRLIELATEAAHIGVDGRFIGYMHGRTDAKRAADAHRESYMAGRNAAFRLLPSLCVHKPHGSLDWFEVDGRVVRCPLPVAKTPIIITPGISKYRESFRWAFDDQRTAGNRAATNATRLMFLGYGFNDDHLEQYLCPGLRLTKPSLIMTKELTANARKVIVNSPAVDVIALSAVSSKDLRTQIVSSRGEEMIVDEQLWNLADFNKGVL